MKNIFSIGYTAFSISEFIDVLKHYEIRAIIDVRSQPYSSRFEKYNKENISQLLIKHKIYYKNYANEFGARQTDRRFFAKDGYLDFEKFAKSDNFKMGFTKIDESMKLGYTFAFMCAEKQPASCHRSILVSRIFRDAGYNVKHILSGGNVESQEDIDMQLLDYYFPDRMQMSFDEMKTEPELLKEAYRKRNVEIGYRLEEELINDYTNDRIHKKNSSAIF